MKRREFLQCAALLTAGTGFVPPSWGLSTEQQQFIAGQNEYIARAEPKLFNTRERELVSVIAEQIIPRTNTPGAIDAGVPRFIEAMVADWFTEPEQQFFMQELQALNKRWPDFLQLSPQAQLNKLEALEDDAKDAPWFNFGNTFRVWDSDAPFICQLKELTVLGFMLSKVGHEQFLRPNPMGAFNGDVALDAGQPAYASDRTMRSVKPPISALED